jgi:hypothetical protein
MVYCGNCGTFFLVWLLVPSKIWQPWLNCALVFWKWIEEERKKFLFRLLRKIERKSEKREQEHFLGHSLKVDLFFGWLIRKTYSTACAEQGCQIFLGPNMPKREKIYQMTTHYTKRPYIIPNGRKIFQIVTKYNNILFSKDLHNLPKLRFLV